MKKDKTSRSYYTHEESGIAFSKEDWLNITTLQGKFSKEEWEKAKKSGVIEKAKLKDGCYYWGTCRNASQARWVSELNCFFYWRTKFGSEFIEPINHPEDDNGFDLFIPLAEVVEQDKIIKIEDESLKWWKDRANERGIS